MLVCPDCRAEIADPPAACGQCGWRPRSGAGFFDYLASRDRHSADLADYIETYEALAERNQSVPVDSNIYVERLSERLADRIGDLSGKDLCDVGSGRGYFVKHALARGARVTAVDIASVSLTCVAETFGIPCYLANAENLPFLGAFDVLAATDILEHVLNMANFLVTANWALRDGGTFAVRVPNRESQLYYSNFHGLPVHFTHLRTFDRTLLLDLVEEFGFKVERIFYDGYKPDYMATWLNRYPNGRRRLRDRLVTRYGADDAGDAPFRRVLMKPIEIGVIARKIDHIVPVDAHQAFRAFAHERRGRREEAAV